jgi:hypothetical protein
MAMSEEDCNWVCDMAIDGMDCAKTVRELYYAYGQAAINVLGMSKEGYDNNDQAEKLIVVMGARLQKLIVLAPPSNTASNK